jgi:hypothetical protein
MKRIVAVILTLLSATAGSSAAEPVGAPGETEWKQAAPARLQRSLHEECNTQAFGEWLRVTCSGRFDYVTPRVIVAAGGGDDVEIDLANNWARVTFPLHRGDRRVLLVGSRVMVSATWLADDDAPTVVVD